MQDKEQQQPKQERREQQSIQLELLSLGGEIERGLTARKNEALGLLAVEE